MRWVGLAGLLAWAWVGARAAEPAYQDEPRHQTTIVDVTAGTGLYERYVFRGRTLGKTGVAMAAGGTGRVLPNLSLGAVVRDYWEASRSRDIETRYDAWLTWQTLWRVKATGNWRPGIEWADRKST